MDKWYKACHVWAKLSGSLQCMQCKSGLTSKATVLEISGKYAEPLMSRHIGRPIERRNLINKGCPKEMVIIIYTERCTMAAIACYRAPTYVYVLRFRVRVPSTCTCACSPTEARNARGLDISQNTQEMYSTRIPKCTFRQQNAATSVFNSQLT